MGGSRRTKEEEEAEKRERKKGWDGRQTMWVPEDVSVYNNNTTTNYFAAFVEERQ